ncbi:MAG: T9SS type A sorting domain-containing protein [Melioribacteraceae bacterium]|nr:T9SS type A sorting domain-containing protein [Melioribacteraceae bacterium]
MKQKMIYFFFFLLTLSLFSQIKNINSLSGTWTGSWINDFFLSTGDAQILIVVDEGQQKVIATFNIGGTALGQSSIDTFIEEVIYNDSGATISLTHEIWGDINGNILFATGEFSGTAEDNPVNPSVGLMTGAGILTSDSLKSTFTMDFSGTMITGGMDLVKENGIEPPSNLTAVQNSSEEVSLSWITNSSNHTGFRLDRWSASEVWIEIAELDKDDVNYIDTEIEGSTNYKYRISAINSDTESEYSNEAEITTITDVNSDELVYKFELYQNYPNPFNPTTVINFSVKYLSAVKLEVFNQNGELVKKLFDGHLAAGEYDINFNASDFASGVYYYRMVANNFISTKKMLLIK